MNDPDNVITVFPDNLNPDMIHLLISEAAYFKAEKRGFEPGHEDEDWLEAEKEIKHSLGSYFDHSYFVEVTH
jgi:DUF2934 family protein